MTIKLLPLLTLTSLGYIVHLLREMSVVGIPSDVVPDAEFSSKNKKVAVTDDAHATQLRSEQPPSGIIFPSNSSTEKRPQNVRVAFMGDSV